MRTYAATAWILPFMLMVSPTQAVSAPYGEEHGIVRMKGSIIDTPCAIAVNDQLQTIRFGTEVIGEMMHNGHSEKHPFYIHLIDCCLTSSTPGKADWSGFNVTFDGDRDGAPGGDLFSIHGASGMGIRITDKQGHVAIPGRPLPAGELVAGKQTLEYQLQLISDSHRFLAGRYQSTVRFKVDYF